MPRVPQVTHQATLSGRSSLPLANNPGAPGVRVDPDQAAAGAKSALRAVEGVQAGLSAARETYADINRSVGRTAAAWGEISRQAEKVHNFGMEMVEREEVTKLGRALSTAEAVMAKKRQEFAGRRDYQQFMPEWEKLVREIEERGVQGLGPIAADRFRERFQRSAIHGYTAVAERSRRIQADEHRAALGDQMADLQGAAVNAASLGHFTQLLGEMKARVQAAVASNTISAATGAATLREAYAEVAAGRLDRMIQVSPDSVLKARKDPQAANGVNSLYKYLSPTAQGMMDRRALAESRSRRAEAERVVNGRIRRAAGMIPDELARITATGQERDGDKIRALLAGKPEALEEFNKTSKQAAQVWAVMEEVGELPLQERALAVERILKPKADDDDFKDKQAIYQKALVEVQRQITAAREDPALAAMPAAKLELAASVAEGLVPPDDKNAQTQAMIKASLAEQDRLGIAPGLRRHLPKEEAMELRESFLKAKPQESFQWLVQAQQRYGDYFLGVLKELKLPVQYGLAASLLDTPHQRQTAQRLVLLAGMSEAQFKVEPSVKSGVKAKVAEAFGETPYGSYLQASATLGGPEALQQLNAWQDLIYKSALAFAAAGAGEGEAAERAAAVVGNSRNTLVDEDLAVVILPSKVDPDVAETGFRSARYKVKEHLMTRHEAELRGVVGPDVKDWKAAYRKRYGQPVSAAPVSSHLQELIQMAVEQGVWVNYGDRFVLVHHQYGKAYTDAQGRPFTITKDQLEAMAAQTGGPASADDPYLLGVMP